MAAAQKLKSFSVKSWGNSEEEGGGGRDGTTMFDVSYGAMREKIRLQRLVVIARLPHDLADRTQLGAHHEKLNFQLSKQHMWEQLTGLLLVYPSCLLHVVESSRDVLLSVLKDVRQQQTDGVLQEAKVVFVAHDPQSRTFPQWSHKVLGVDQVGGAHGAAGLEEEEEESTESLVCGVLSALQNLGERLEASKKAPPGSVLDQSPELIVSQEVLEKLLAREELLAPQLYLQLYNSPSHICMDFGQVIRSSCLTRV